MVIVMEYCDGPSLRALSTYSKKFEGKDRETLIDLEFSHLRPGRSLPGLLVMIEQMLMGLERLHSLNIIHRDIKRERLHSLGIIHRDIKPANIMVCKVPGCDIPCCKLIDLGLCRRLYEGESVAMTHDSVSPIFSAPEKFQDIHPDGYDTGIDIWALGITLTQIITADCVLGDPGSLYGLIDTLDEGRVRRLTDEETGIPGLANVINSMLECNPEIRPSASQLLEMIRAVQSERRMIHHRQMIDKIPKDVLESLVDQDSKLTHLFGSGPNKYAFFGSALSQAHAEEQRLLQEAQERLSKNPAPRSTPPAAVSRSAPRGRRTRRSKRASPATVQSKPSKLSYINHVYGPGADIDLQKELDSIIKATWADPSEFTYVVLTSRSGVCTTHRGDVIQLFTELDQFEPATLDDCNPIKAVVMYKVEEVDLDRVHKHLLSVFARVGVTDWAATECPVPVLVHGFVDDSYIDMLRETCTSAWAASQGQNN
ncbi:hypothetical protein KIPB_003097 [Kipferlia bialata]|uniref:non-specific serine/threonine protein kinase n=1 Tax=Kipferlia bialata TaxID=797122 RepID=A0A9K3CT92_9EUKA|nr:hypothetical protein KIPB_003097 [Kipferlia bialata]|eukprot:g3097.t1